MKKYEVVKAGSGLYFIAGGDFYKYMGIESKKDADTICEALNTVEKLKIRRILRDIDRVRSELEALAEAMLKD